MPKLDLGTVQLVYCNTCKGETRHELRISHTRNKGLIHSKDEGDEYTGFEEVWEFHLWVCRGCDMATLEVAYTNTGMLDAKGRDNVWESAFYPSRERRHWQSKRFRQLDEKLSRIYREMVQSFNNDSRTLCAVGLRVLLEGICANKGVTGRNLEQKINNLQAHLPSNIVESLHSFRFMGNEAVHELQAPSRRDLALAIEVMEDLLNFLYELDYKARHLSEELTH